MLALVGWLCVGLLVFSLVLLFGCFEVLLEWFRLALFGLVFLIGTLVGLELPLLMRILKEHLDFSDLVSRVLTFDYIGALLASVLFPVLLVPYLGLVRTSLIFGMLNGLVGLWGTYLLRPILHPRGLDMLRARAVCTTSRSERITKGVSDTARSSCASNPPPNASFFHQPPP